MLAPQSDDEIRPVECALRELDDRIRVKWNPRALITRPGYIDATGKCVPPEHDGRWCVVVERPGEEDHCIYQVRWDGEGNEAYRPVGPWLIEFMRLWDRQNQHYVAEMQRMLADDDTLQRHAQQAQDEEDREFWGRVGFALGGEELIGRGFGTGITQSPVPSDTPSGDLTAAAPSVAV